MGCNGFRPYTASFTILWMVDPLQCAPAVPAEFWKTWFKKKKQFPVFQFFFYTSRGNIGFFTSFWKFAIPTAAVRIFRVIFYSRVSNPNRITRKVCSARFYCLSPDLQNISNAGSLAWTLGKTSGITIQAPVAANQISQHFYHRLTIFMNNSCSLPLSLIWHE